MIKGVHDQPRTEEKRIVHSHLSQMLPKEMNVTHGGSIGGQGKQ